MAQTVREPKVIWKAQDGPQQAFVSCPVFEVVFGGARGGGKTEACFGDWMIHAATYGPHAQGIFLRRELPQLDSAIQRAKELFLPLGAEWKEQAKTFIFPNGATLKFRPMERDADAEKYQGQSFTRVYAEELTNWPAPYVLKLLATLRSANGVPVGFRATCNPGGPGHNWVKARYIDNGAYQVIRDHGSSRVFIPARVTDNPALLNNDPGYIDRLRQSGSEQLVKAWLEGDWDIVEGAFFDCFTRAKHVIFPFEIPEHWTRIVGFDWGSARPFSVGWWAVASETMILSQPEGKIILPRDSLIRYREWYGASAPNVGLKMGAEEVARGIVSREARNEKISARIADPAIFAANGGPSIAERMGDYRVFFQPGDNTRVTRQQGGSGGPLSGWDQVRARLLGEDMGPLGKRPMMYIFATCLDWIRTVPVLQHDKTRAEDIDTNGEDHAADETRYVCLSRPIRGQPTSPPPPPDYRRGRRTAGEEDWRTI